jgi:hypothetical protein
MRNLDFYLRARARGIYNERARAKQNANPRPCANCTEVKPIVLASEGLCGACRVYRRRHGVMRPLPDRPIGERITAIQLANNAARRGFAITPELAATWRERLERREVTLRGLAREVRVSTTTLTSHMYYGGSRIVQRAAKQERRMAVAP